MESLSAFRKRVDSWLDSVEIPSVPLELDERISVLRGWQRVLYDHGFVGVDWPIHYGGQGLTLLHGQELAESLIAHRAPFPANRVGLEVVGPTMIAFASEALCDRMLPQMLTGEEICCVALSEPDSGSDLGSVSTSAIPDGDDYIVNGQKIWSSFAAYASYAATLVRTDRSQPGPRGLSFLAIKLDSPGITIRPIVQMTGDREFCEIFFTDVRVSKSQLIGPEGAGWRSVTHTLGGERGLLSKRRQAELSVTLTDVVQQFESQGLLELPDVVRDIGRIVMQLHVLQAQFQRTTKRIMENGSASSPYDSADKWQLSLTEQNFFRTVISHLPDARANVDAYVAIDSRRWFYDFMYSKAAAIYSGTDQIQANILATTMLGLPPQPRGDADAR